MLTNLGKALRVVRRITRQKNYQKAGYKALMALRYNHPEEFGKARLAFYKELESTQMDPWLVSNVENSKELRVRFARQYDNICLKSKMIREEKKNAKRT